MTPRWGRYRRRSSARPCAWFSLCLVSRGSGHAWGSCGSRRRRKREGPGAVGPPTVGPRRRRPDFSGCPRPGQGCTHFTPSASPSEEDDADKDEELQSLLRGAEERARAAVLARDRARHDLSLADGAQRELQRELLDKVKETAAANVQLTAALAERDAAVNCVNMLLHAMSAIGQ